jgi:hypothetical protein
MKSECIAEFKLFLLSCHYKDGYAAKNTDHKMDGFVAALLVKLQCKKVHARPDTNCHNETDFI